MPKSRWDANCKHYQSMLFSARAQPIKAAQSVLEGVAALDTWRTLEYFRLLRCRLQTNPSKTLRWQKCLACDVCSTTLVQLRIANYLRIDLEQQLAAGAANNVPGNLLVDIPLYMSLPTLWKKTIRQLQPYKVFVSRVQPGKGAIHLEAFPLLLGVAPVSM